MLRKNFDKLFVLFTFVLITITAIVFKQHPFRFLPLCVSLIIYFLQARVSRYAYLLGSLNSIAYAIVYIGLGVYASAAQALLISFPLQMATFFMWRRRADGHSTRLRHLGGGGALLTLALFAAAWVAVYFVLRELGSASQILDNTSTLLGVLIYILTMFSFIEYTYLQILSNIVGILLQISLMKENPGQITYVIQSACSCFFAVRAIFRANALYKKQQKEIANENS
ncbi:MAG: nicotinamide mononucleotide transporter [Clostridia bacterium]|nr:nicotinamide mononucleotide transporter [Clostridia bacterium]